MTFQTSDVDTTNTRMRIVTIFHCLAAFVFNIGVLAFTWALGRADRYGPDITPRHRRVLRVVFWFGLAVIATSGITGWTVS